MCTPSSEIIFCRLLTKKHRHNSTLVKKKIPNKNLIVDQRVKHLSFLTVCKNASSIFVKHIKYFLNENYLLY